MSTARTPGSGVSAIVLAGGRSRRFGRDKLVEPVEGRPLLDRAVAAVGAVAGDVVVCAAPGARPPLPAGVRLAHDETAHEGPLAGSLAGLLAAREPISLIVAGDMPSLQPAVLDLLVRAVIGSTAEAAVLEHLGRRQQLPLAVRTGAATDAARRLVADGERRLGALLDRLRVLAVPEEEWRALDPAAATVRDVDVPADLRRGDG